MTTARGHIGSFAKGGTVSAIDPGAKAVSIVMEALFNGCIGSDAAVTEQQLFNPTGDLAKDYSAYCETDGFFERDDILNAISVLSASERPAATGIETYKFSARNLTSLTHRDMIPLARAIPHCRALPSLQFSGCSMTEHCLQLLVEAVYRSNSVTFVGIDFNPDGLSKDLNGASALSVRSNSPAHISRRQWASQTSLGLDGLGHVRVGDIEPIYLYPHQKGLLQLPGAELSWKAADKGGDLTEGNDGTHGINTKGKNDKVGKSDKGRVEKEKSAKDGAQRGLNGDGRPAAMDPIPVPIGWHGLLLTGIRQLSLRGNDISDKMIEPMAELLERPSSELYTLNLWGNSITSAGAIMLANALQSNRRLTALNLGHNKIDDHGAIALASIFYATDVTSEKAQEMRLRTIFATQEVHRNIATPPSGLTAIGFSHVGDAIATQVKKGTKEVVDPHSPALYNASCFPDGLSSDSMTAMLQGTAARPPLPNYPLYADIVAPVHRLSGADDDGGDKGAMEDGGWDGGGGSRSPLDKIGNTGVIDKDGDFTDWKLEYDACCIRMAHDVVRIPGNTSLWSLNLSHNRKISAKGVQAFVDLVASVFAPENHYYHQQVRDMLTTSQEMCLVAEEFVHHQPNRQLLIAESDHNIKTTTASSGPQSAAATNSTNGKSNLQPKSRRYAIGFNLEHLDLDNTSLQLASASGGEACSSAMNTPASKVSTNSATATAGVANTENAGSSSSFTQPSANNTQNQQPSRLPQARNTEAITGASNTVLAHSDINSHNFVTNTTDGGVTTGVSDTSSSSSYRAVSADHKEALNATAVSMDKLFRALQLLFAFKRRYQYCHTVLSGPHPVSCE